MTDVKENANVLANLTSKYIFAKALEMSKDEEDIGLLILNSCIFLYVQAMCTIYTADEDEVGREKRLLAQMDEVKNIVLDIIGEKK